MLNQRTSYALVVSYMSCNPLAEWWLTRGMLNGGLLMSMGRKPPARRMSRLRGVVRTSVFVTKVPPTLPVG